MHFNRRNALKILLGSSLALASGKGKTQEKPKPVGEVSREELLRSVVFKFVETVPEQDNISISFVLQDTHDVNGQMIGYVLHPTELHEANNYGLPFRFWSFARKRKEENKPITPKEFENYLKADDANDVVNANFHLSRLHPGVEVLHSSKLTIKDLHDLIHRSFKAHVSIPAYDAENYDEAQFKLDQAAYAETFPIFASAGKKLKTRYGTKIHSSSKSEGLVHLMTVHLDKQQAPIMVSVLAITKNGKPIPKKMLGQLRTSFEQANKLIEEHR